MPTLLRVNGFKFFFYANDHAPAHVHVIRGNGWAKIEMETARLVYSSLKPQETKEAARLAVEHRKEFLEAWHDWFSR